MENTLEVLTLKRSLQDCPQRRGTENEVRYKLIIDPSEDDSLVRLLFSFGVFKEDNTHTFMCSDFSGDGPQEKVLSINKKFPFHSMKSLKRMAHKWKANGTDMLIELN